MSCRCRCRSPIPTFIDCWPLTQAAGSKKSIETVGSVLIVLVLAILMLPMRAGPINVSCPGAKPSICDPNGEDLCDFVAYAGHF